MIEKRIRLKLITTNTHGDLIDNNQYLFLTIDQLNKAIIHSFKSNMYKLRLDGHFYTVLDDKIFDEISDQW